MTGVAAIAAFILLFFLEGAICVLLGEIAARWLLRTSLLRHRLLEPAFLFGMAFWALAGYAALNLTFTAVSVVPVTLLAAAGLWLYRPGETALPHALRHYLEWRTQRWFLAAAGMVVVVAVVVAFDRAGLATGENPAANEGMVAGTPISLASLGFPLRHPEAPEQYLTGPAGASVIAAGNLALTPSWGRPILAADLTLHAVFYGCSMLLAIAWWLASPLARAVAAGCALMAAGLQQGPFFVLLVHSPHAVSAAAWMQAALWIVQQRPWAAALFAALGASTSLELTVAALAVGIGLLLLRAGQFREAAWRQTLAVLLLAVAVLGCVYLSVFRQETAAANPWKLLFPMPTGEVLRAVALSLAAYSALLAAAFLGRARLATIWWLPAVVVTAVALFAQDARLALHMVFGMLCGVALERTSGMRQALLGLAGLLVTAGFLTSLTDWQAEQETEVRPSSAMLEAARWVERHTPPWKRVVAYRAPGGRWEALFASMRPGSEAGQDAAVHHSALTVGSALSLEERSRLSAGVWANDYVIAPVARPNLDALLVACGAVEHMRNAEVSVREVTPECRARVSQPALAAQMREAVLREQLRVAREQKIDPEKLPAELLSFVVVEEPVRMFQLRHAVEPLWGAGRFEDAREALERVVAAHPQVAEAQYSYAFTLHASGKYVAQSIGHYGEALRNGYDEFWVRYGRGSAYLVLKRYQEAEEDLARAVALRPNDAAAKDQWEKAKSGR